MNQKQANFLTMAQGVLVHFSGKPDAWSHLTLLGKTRAEIEAQVLSAQQTSEAQTELGVGHTQQKNELLEDMLDEVHQLSRKLSAYARLNNDPILLQAVNFSRSALSVGQETLVYNRCVSIVGKAKELLPKLTDLLVVQADIDELDKLLAAYKIAPAERDVVKGNRVTATQTLPDLLASLREKFQILDDLVYSLVDDQAFVSTYRTLRQIGSRGASKTTVNSETTKATA